MRTNHFFGKSKKKKMMDEEHSVRVMVSNERLNRRRLVVLNSAYEMDDFMKHPVLLASHGRYSFEDIIGRWHDMEVEDEGLMGTAEYFMNRMQAPMAWDLVTRGLAAYSIGFMVREAKFGKEITESKDIPRRIKNKHPWAVFMRIELEEISQCVIPVNADAVNHSELEKNPDMMEFMQFAYEEGFYEEDPFAKYREEQEKKKQEEDGEKTSEQLAKEKEESEKMAEEKKIIEVPFDPDAEEAKIKYFMSCNNLHDIAKEIRKAR